MGSRKFYSALQIAGIHRVTLADSEQQQHIQASQATNVKSRRFYLVTRPSSCSAPEARARAYRVERPRASDAIAVSLRDAFSREPGLPEDMAAILRCLNRHEISMTR